MKTVAGEGRKSAKFWAPRPSGPPFGPRAPPFGPPRLPDPIFSRFGPPPFGDPPFCGPKNSTYKNWPKSKLAEAEIAEVDRARRPSHTTPVRNCSSTCSAAPRCHPLRAIPGIASSKETCPGWRPWRRPHWGQSNPHRDGLLPAMGRCSNMETSITALKGHAHLVGDGRMPLPDCGQCIGPAGPVCANLVPRGAPQPQPSVCQRHPGSVHHLLRAGDVQQLAKTVRHGGVMCSRKGIGPRRVDNSQQIVRPGRCTEEQEEPRALQIAHCHDPAEKGGVFLVRGRTSTSTWSPCPNGVPNTRIPCSLVDNDWSPLHTITGRMALLPASTICSQPTGKTPATVPQLRLPLIDSDSRVVPQSRLDRCMQKAMRSGAPTIKMSSRKANSFSLGNNTLQIASRASC